MNWLAQVNGACRDDKKLAEAEKAQRGSRDPRVPTHYLAYPHQTISSAKPCSPDPRRHRPLSIQARIRASVHLAPTQNTRDTFCRDDRVPENSIARRGSRDPRVRTRYLAQPAPNEQQRITVFI